MNFQGRALLPIFFNNPFDTLNVLKTLELAEVVAERSMQKMDGLELLKRFKMISLQAMA